MSNDRLSSLKNEPADPSRAEKYIITALEDGLIVIREMMDNLSPYHSYSIAELAQKCTSVSQNKLFRIIKTLEKHGFVEVDTAQRKRYRIGHSLLYLSHRYFRALEREHQRIKQEINSFKVEY